MEAFAVGFSDAELVAILPVLRRVAYARAHNKDRAEDLLQTTLLRMIDKKHQFQSGTNLAAWGCTIMQRFWYSEHRDAARHLRWDIELVPEPLSTENIERAYEVREELGRVAQLRIPPVMWEALMCVTVEGMQYQEAAEHLGIAIGTVKSRVNRARQFMPV